MAETNPKTPHPTLSKTPSWIMVGFIAGALFAYGVRREVVRHDEAKPSPPAAQIPMPAEQCSTAAPMVNQVGAGCLPAMTTLT